MQRPFHSRALSHSDTAVLSETKSQKRKITTKPLSEKYKAIQVIEKGLSKMDVAEKYGVPFSTLSM